MEPVAGVTCQCFVFSAPFVCSHTRARDDETLQAVADGIRLYFDKSLGQSLLYAPERKQYEDVVASQTAPSDVYGIEHLLRLFGMEGNRSNSLVLTTA